MENYDSLELQHQKQQMGLGETPAPAPDKKKWYEVAVDAVTTGADVFTKMQQSNTPSTAVMPAQKSTPWVPIGLGAAGLAAVYMFTRKKKK